MLLTIATNRSSLHSMANSRFLGGNALVGCGRGETMMHSPRFIDHLAADYAMDRCKAPLQARAK